MRAPRIKLHFFTRLFLGHLLAIGLIILIAIVSFRLYMKDHVYNTITAELNSYADVIIRTVQKNEETALNNSPGGGAQVQASPLVSSSFQAALSERKISFVLMNKNGDVLFRDQRTLSQEYKNKAFLQSLQSHILLNTMGKSFIEHNSPDPLLVQPRTLKGKSQTLYLFVMSPEQGLKETLQRVNRTALLLFIPALLLAVAVSALLSGGMSRSVKKLREATQRITAGAYSARTDVMRSDELGDLARDFNLMASRLEEASSKLDQYELNRRRFITDVTHELRTPLTSIRGIMEGLSNDFVTDPTEQKRYYAIIEKETFRLIRLINELLDLERIENGLIELKYGEYRLKDLLEDVSESLDVLIEEKNIRLVLECGDVITFNGDYDRIVQVVLNLAKNSIQFTAHGSVRITGTETSEHTVITVTDTGQGISPQELNRIWERFYKEDPSRAKQRSETGLGLSIVRQLVEAHHGEITVASELGIGTEFTIRLPKPEEKLEPKPKPTDGG